MKELDSKKDQKKDLLEGMHEKLRNEIERVAKDRKVYQREVDKLEYELEENEKDLKNSKDQIGKEKTEREKLSAEHSKHKSDVDAYL